MANQYPPTRTQYVDSVSRRASNFGAVLGMAAAIGVMATSGAPPTLLTMVFSSLALAVGAAIGMVVMSVVGTLYASSTYRRRYRKDFEQAHDLATALAEDPTLTPSSPPLTEHALAELPPPASFSAPSAPEAGMESYVERLREERELAASEQRAL